MQGRCLRKDLGELVRIHGGDPASVEILSESLDEEEGCPECPFERNLLIEGHPEEQGEGALAEEEISLAMAGQVQCHGAMVGGNGCREDQRVADGRSTGQTLRRAHPRNR